MLWKRKDCRKDQSGVDEEALKNVEVSPMSSSVVDVAVVGGVDSHEFDKYEGYPLLHSLLQNEAIRNAELDAEGTNQIQYPQSTDGWIASLFSIRGRALDWIIFPFFVVMLHAIIYTVVQETYGNPKARNLQSWEIFFGILLNSTLSFLLVFRLNRAAGRYWTARFYWGDIVAKGRTLCSGILCHGDHDPIHRNNAIRWVGGFAVCAMEFLRGLPELRKELFAGLLSADEVRALQENGHPPLYAIDQIRINMKQVFHVDADTPLALAQAWTQQLDTLEKSLNVCMDNCGGMERIRATPLPLVYVSHLRTFLLIALFLLPYVLGPSWGWGTIPVVAATAFALLGIEAAAAEVESPFALDRVNALNMDTFCKSFILNIQQQVKCHADREIAGNTTRMPSEQLVSV